MRRAEGGVAEDAIELAEYIGISSSFVDATDIAGCSAIYQTGLAAAAIEAGLADVVMVVCAAPPRRFPSAPEGSVLAIVQLEGGVRITMFLVGAAPELIHIGMQVAAYFGVENGAPLLLFKPRE